MGKTWNTQYGPRRVREEPPSLDEAIFAARGLSDDPNAQAEIAASLMGVAVEQVRVAMIKSSQRKDIGSSVTFTKRAGAERAVVVERKPMRRVGGIRPLGDGRRRI
jgi:hypothetical protein